MSVDKEIKFKFVVDQTSINYAKSQIEGLVSALGRLQGEAQRAVTPIQQAFSGILGADGKPISSVGAAGNSGPLASAAKATNTQSQKITLGGSGGNISTSFTKLINEHKTLFKGMAQGGQEGMDSMTRALKKAVGEQTQELDKLEKKLSKIQTILTQKAAEYQKARDSGDTVSASMIKSQMDKLDIVGVRRAADKAEVSKQLELFKDLEPKAAPASPKWYDMFAPRSVLGKYQGQAEALATSGLNKMGLGAFSGMARAGLRGLGRGGLVTAGTWGAEGIGYFSNNDFFGYGQRVFDDQKYAAQWGQAYSQRSLEARDMNLRNMVKEQEILSDPEKAKIYRGIGTGIRGGWESFKTRAGLAADFRFGEAFSWDSAPVELEFKKQRDQYIDNERAAEPLTQRILAEAEDYQGTLGKLRALGMGARPGETGYQALARVRQIAPTFSEGEIIATKQAIEAAGTRKGALALTPGVLQAQAAGIAGIAPSTGTMSKFGAGSSTLAKGPDGQYVRGPDGKIVKNTTLGVGDNFLTAARQYVGGGVDAVSVGLASQFVAQQQQQLGMSTSVPGSGFQGSALMSMLMAGGNDPRTGRLNVEQNIRGAEYMQRSLLGQTSPYQEARNLMIAAQVAPDLSSYGQSFLARKMSLSEILDASKGGGGDVNDIFKYGFGGNKEQARQYLIEHNKSLLEGIQFSGNENDGSGQIAKALADSGLTYKEFFDKKLYENLGFNKKQAKSALAGAFMANDVNLDGAGAQGMVRMVLGEEGKKGKAVGDSAGGSPEAKVAAEHVKALGTQADKAAGALERLMKAAEGLALREEVNERMRLNANNMSDQDRLNMEEATGRAISKGEYNMGAVNAISKELEVAKHISNMSTNQANIYLLTKTQYKSSEARDAFVRNNADVLSRTRQGRDILGFYGVKPK